MKNKIEIRDIYGKIIFAFEQENATIKDAVMVMIKNEISLKNANLTNANLTNADLINANLENANLKNANLKNANLENANLTNAYLRNADLENANLKNANLKNANLENANLTNAYLRNANLTNADLENANLKNANLENANLTNANMPIFCKWRFSIINNEIIKIGCKEKNIADWDLFFNSNEIYTTERNTKDFKKIKAVFEACKSYLNFLNNEK
jgi:hypothetical protein